MASADWERHKATILHLYLIEKTPLHQVVSYMQEKHSFAKNKNQYEYQFKKWGVKKNVKKEDWQHLRHQLQKRTGKQSEVTLFGIPLSPRRVRKETQRYTAIPTARDFGIRPPSPEAPMKMIVRAKTPTIIIEECIWPPLPWFQFKNRVFLELRNPSALLNTFFAALGSEQGFYQFGEKNVFKSLFEMSRNPLELRKMAFRLTDMIPDDTVGGRQKAEASTDKQLSLSMATEMLKLVFFSLSNSNIPYYNQRDLRAHDQFVLHLVEAVSHTNPGILLFIFSSHCTTANAIKEAVYGSAIREKNYTMVSRLLESGVDPNIEILSVRATHYKIQRGLIQLDCRRTYFNSSGIFAAALTYDIRLAKILLNAGASVGTRCVKYWSALEVAAGSTCSNSVEFVQLLLEHGALSDNPTSCRNCRRFKLMLPIAVSIATRNDCMMEFLMEKDVSIGSYEYFEALRSGCDVRRKWHSFVFQDLELDSTLLNFAIISGNEDFIERLLGPVLSHLAQAPVRVAKQILIVSCLAGHADTASKILAYCPKILAVGPWTAGVTPLVATAWNEDNTIAELLLGLGARVGPKLGDGILQQSEPAPIHVAAYYGNTNLVRHLIDRGADCNVRFKPPLNLLHKPLHWLLPIAVANPLQLALWNGAGDTATLLISHHANTLGVGSAQAVDQGHNVPVSDLVSQGASILSANQGIREIILEANVEISNAVSIIRSYFSLGGLYRSKDLYLAVKAAIKTKDYSIVRLLADCRPVREIDSYEASAFVISLEEREWNLVSLLLCDPFLPGLSRSYYDLEIPGGLLYIADSAERSPSYTGDGLTPLGCAIHSAIDSVVERMIRQGYKLQNEDMSLLAKDVLGTREVILNLCLESKVLSNRQALLLHSIQSRDIQTVHKCIKLVDSLNFAFRDKKYSVLDDLTHDRFPLGIAAACGNVELIHLLLDAGATANFRAPYTNTALEVAAINGHLDVVNSLLDRGAMVEPPVRLVRGGTALQYSAIKGHLNMAKLLISRGANINTLPAKLCGRTALEGAAENGRLDMVQFLLKMGAELEGEMRIYYVRSVGFARQKGHFAIARLLKEYGSWGERDQVLYNRPNILQEMGYFRYDAGIGDWRVRWMKFMEYASCDGAAPTKGYFCSPDGASDASDDGIGQADSIEDDAELPEDDGNDELSDGSYDIDCVPQAWWEGPDLTVADLNSHNFTDEQALGYDLVPTRTLASQRVIELDGTLEDGDVAQDSTDYNACNEATADCLARDQPNTWKQGGIIREGEAAEFEITNYTTGIGSINEQSTPLDAAVTEWEGPFSNFSEIDDINEMFGVLPFRFLG
ncbi:ankyrin repeat-containing domain protein [Xylaria telfairii]|nr:ankyrin repeat-containing domain protein [Xylaria telfairii]